MIRDGIIYDITDDILRVDWVDKRCGAAPRRVRGETRHDENIVFADFFFLVFFSHSSLFFH